MMLQRPPSYTRWLFWLSIQRHTFDIRRTHKADMSTWSSRDFIRVDKVLYVRCTETQLGIHAEKDL